MNALTDSRISALQQQAGEKGVLNYTIGDGCFRINLLDDNIALWQETFAKNSSAANSTLTGSIKSSSRVSLIAHSLGDSPASRRPPGPLIFPAPRPRFFLISRICPPLMTNIKVAISCGTQVFQSISATFTIQ